MSIKSYVEELNSIELELKRLGLEAKKLREKKATVKKRIADFLSAKGQVGVKHHGKAYTINEKVKRKSKGNKLKDQDAKKVLEEWGIEEPEKLLEELLEARRGEKETISDLKTEKIRRKKN